MATTVVASCGFIQSSLHSLFNFPLTVPAEEEPRRDLHKHISGHLEMLKLLFYPLFIITMVGLNTLQACFLNRWVWAPKQTWLIWKSCQHRRWRKWIRSSGYRSPIWHDTERKPGSHSGICHSFFTEASRNSAISWSLFQDHTGAADFLSYKEFLSIFLSAGISDWAHRAAVAAFSTPAGRGIICPHVWPVSFLRKVN